MTAVVAECRCHYCALGEPWDCEGEPRRRLLWVDGARGLAILLMVLDHVLVQVDPYSSLRSGAPWSITRLSLPLFMLAAAQVWRPSAPWQLGRVKLLGVGLSEWVLMQLLGMQVPGIVLVIWLVYCYLDVLAMVCESCALDFEDFVWAIGVGGLVQALYVPAPWAGYQPGLVLAWWALGRMFVPSAGLAAAECRPLAWVGRYPLTWYVGHLVAIAVALVVVARG